MKTAYLASLLSALALGAGAYATDTISLEFGPAYGGQNPWQAGGGGEFTAFASTGIPAGYASDATLTLGGQTGFETFCIQPNVDATNESAYDFVVTPNIWVPTSGNSAAGATQEALSQGSAWLYTQFATGMLAGYDYADNNKSNSRLNDASALQQAMWYLQGETYAPTNDPFVNLAVSEFGSLSAAMAAETPNQFGTNVADLYTADANGNPSTLAQDVLVYTGGGTPSAPDGTSTVLLLGATLLGFALAARRQEQF